jgi:flagellar protein FlaG
MSFEIGNLPPVQPSLSTWRPETKRFSLDLARTNAPAADSVELSLPASPPPEILDEIGAAAERAQELAGLNRELHFRKDETSGRVIVEVRDFDGNVIRTIPPSHALDVMAGGAI